MTPAATTTSARPKRHPKRSWEERVPENAWSETTVMDGVVRDKVRRIRSAWSQQERAQRALLGRARRQELARLLGLLPQQACA